MVASVVTLTTGITRAGPHARKRTFTTKYQLMTGLDALQITLDRTGAAYNRFLFNLQVQYRFAEDLSRKAAGTSARRKLRAGEEI